MSKNKGWKKEPARHSLAAKGVRTLSKYHVSLKEPTAEMFKRWHYGGEMRRMARYDPKELLTPEDLKIAKSAVKTFEGLYDDVDELLTYEVLEPMTQEVRLSTPISVDDMFKLRDLDPYRLYLSFHLMNGKVHGYEYISLENFEERVHKLVLELGE